MAGNAAIAAFRRWAKDKTLTEVLKLSHGDTFMAGWEEGEAERKRLRDALEDASAEGMVCCSGCERVAEITYKALGWGDPAHVAARKGHTT